MVGAVPVLWWFDRFDERIGILPVAGELVHTEELNGEDTLEFETCEVPSKGDRLLWRDGETWREHIAVRTDEPYHYTLPPSVAFAFALARCALGTVAAVMLVRGALGGRESAC